MSRDIGLGGSEFGAGERVARHLGLEAPQRDPGSYQLVHSPQHRREIRGVELREHVLGFLQTTDQKESAHFEVPRVRGVQPVAIRFECRASRVERFHWPA